MRRAWEGKVLSSPAERANEGFPEVFSCVFRCLCFIGEVSQRFRLIYFFLITEHGIMSSEFSQPGRWWGVAHLHTCPVPNRPLLKSFSIRGRRREKLACLRGLFARSGSQISIIWMVPAGQAEQVLWNRPRLLTLEFSVGRPPHLTS